MSEEQGTREMTVEEMVEKGRADLLPISAFILSIKSNSRFNQDSLQQPGEDRGEAIANIMLAYRHLEDARMRLGKVFQALDGGESAYKK